MTIEVLPTGAALGAEIRGVDIRQPLAGADRDAIRRAWQDHLVLLIRGQPMTDAELMGFARQFGALELSASPLAAQSYGVQMEARGGERVPPEIAVISNIMDGGKPIGALGAGEAYWHTDSSFVERPPAGSFLHALEVPPAGAGGSTHFLNMYAAYEALEPALKARVRGLEANHSVTHNSGGELKREYAHLTDVREMPGAVHPLVRIHPETGREALFLGRRINSWVVGLPVAESEALLDTLWEHATQPRFTWGHDWRVGDLIIWDNRCTMHRREPFDPSSRRLMHRTQIVGDRPIAA
jgi:taurine dioxygenase